ncbi:MAG: thiamine-phosphate kinase [Pseudomonadota bacterium]
MTIGERELIAHYFAPLVRSPGAHQLRDDCAVLRPAMQQSMVVKTDPIREGVHFFEDDDPADIGWKALAVNVSDLAAKSARPVGYLMAVSFPEAPDLDWLRRFIGGLSEAQDVFGCTLLGGDTDRAPGPLSISVTVFGEVPHGRMILRETASEKDLVYVSGTLGAAAVGLSVRQMERGDTPLVDVSALRKPLAASARDRYVRPQPRLGLKAALRRVASAAMDLSDGLALDAARLTDAVSDASGGPFGMEIDLARIPVAPELSAAGSGGGLAPADIFRLALGHGDDYEILATVAPGDADTFEALARAADVPVSCVGVCNTTQAMTFCGDGHVVDALSGLGYLHF